MSQAPAPSSSGTNNMPGHIAIIMDGNGRWAKKRALPRTAGHKKGADSLRRVLGFCRDANVRYLTVYAFSSENWKRPEDEVKDLMGLLRHYLDNEIQELHEKHIRVRFIGDHSTLNEDLRERVRQAHELTKNNSAFHLTVALSYGARDEIVRGVQKLAQQVKSGELDPENITEDAISHMLDTADMPEPDLLIRTGSEMRLSNFLLWQSAYTELYFTETLWPDFNQEHFDNALTEFTKRERRYGNA